MARYRFGAETGDRVARLPGCREHVVRQIELQRVADGGLRVGCSDEGAHFRYLFGQPLGATEPLDIAVPAGLLDDSSVA